MPTSRSIERRGRGARGSILPYGVPGRQTRSDAFDQLAITAFSDIDAAWHERLTKLDIAVDDIPKISARNPQTVVWPPEVVADGPVPLARLVPAGLTRDGRPTRARLVLFRRPLELRARRPDELVLLIHDVMVEQIADYLGVTPDVIDPTLGDE
ncbi:MAG: metallopeptidase family protein [Tomitella sp.]|nr:metallopeptidase family protein [Tomitella sp.]